MAVIDAVIRERAHAAVRVLAQRARVRAAYLFGSQVEGKADRWSDIDIAAFIEGAEQWDLRQRVRASAEAQRQVGNDVELHFFPVEYLEHAPPGSFAEYVLRHGTPVDIEDICPAPG